MWLTWTDPQDATIVGYDYQQWQTGGRWSAWTAMEWALVPRVYQSVTRYRVTGLDNDVAYRFRVRARTGAGATSLPAGVAATPVAVVPAQPTGLTARAGLGVVVLTWADPGDASIRRYEYLQQTGTGPAGGWVNLPADSFAPPASHQPGVSRPSPRPDSARTIRHEVAGLASGTPYTFRVRAVNAAGPSPASAAVTVTPRPRPPAPPAPPANVAVIPVRTSQGQSVDVYWPDPGDPTITRTEYSLDHGRTWRPLTPNTEFTVPGGGGAGAGAPGPHRESGLYPARALRERRRAGRAVRAGALL